MKKSVLIPLAVFALFSLGAALLVVMEFSQTNVKPGAELVAQFQKQKPEAQTVTRYECISGAYYVSATADGKTRFYFNERKKYVCTRIDNGAGRPEGGDCDKRFNGMHCNKIPLWPASKE